MRIAWIGEKVQWMIQEMGDYGRHAPLWLAIGSLRSPEDTFLTSYKPAGSKPNLWGWQGAPDEQAKENLLLSPS